MTDVARLKQELATVKANNESLVERLRSMDMEEKLSVQSQVGRAHAGHARARSRRAGGRYSVGDVPVGQIRDATHDVRRTRSQRLFANRQRSERKRRRRRYLVRAVRRKRTA